MSSTKKTPAVAMAKFATAPANHTPAALVTAIQHQIGAIEQCADYAKQPTVQAATTLLSTDSTTLGATISQIVNLRAQLTALEAARAGQMTKVNLDRKNAEAAITIACGGDPNLIKGYGCVAQSRTVTPASTAAPLGLTAKPSVTTPGTVTLKCKAVSGATYLFQVATDPTTAAGAGTPLISSKSTLTLTGQPIGHVLYVRAAVVRRNGGESLWTDAIQVTVR